MMGGLVSFSILSAIIKFLFYVLGILCFIKYLKQKWKKWKKWKLAASKIAINKLFCDAAFIIDTLQRISCKREY